MKTAELVTLIQDYNERWKLNEENPNPDYYTTEREHILLDMGKTDIKKLIDIISELITVGVEREVEE